MFQRWTKIKFKYCLASNLNLFWVKLPCFWFCHMQNPEATLQDIAGVQFFSWHLTFNFQVVAICRNALANESVIWRILGDFSSFHLHPKEKFRHHQLRSVLDDGKVEDETWESMRLSGLCQAHAEAENDEHERHVCSIPYSCGWDVIAIGRR